MQFINITITWRPHTWGDGFEAFVRIELIDPCMLHLKAWQMITFHWVYTSCTGVNIISMLVSMLSYLLFLILNLSEHQVRSKECAFLTFRVIFKRSCNVK